MRTMTVVGLLVAMAGCGGRPIGVAEQLEACELALDSPQLRLAASTGATCTSANKDYFLAEIVAGDAWMTIGMTAAPPLDKTLDPANDGVGVHFADGRGGSCLTMAGAVTIHDDGDAWAVRVDARCLEKGEDYRITGTLSVPR